MNEPIESPNDQPKGSTNELERQLRALQPRAPRLDWNAITSNESSADEPRPAPAAISISPMVHTTGITASHLMWAVAAAWLFGALVGGGSTYWMTEAASQRYVSQDIAPDNSNQATASIEIASIETAEPAAQTPVALPETSQFIPRNVDAHPLDLEIAAWSVTEPLHVRSLVTRGGAKQFISTGASMPNLSTDSLDAAQRSTSESSQSDASDWERWNSESDHRLNVRQQYLKEMLNQLH